MTNQEISREIQGRQTTLKDTVQSKINALRSYQENMERKVLVLQDTMPLVSNALAYHGLEISSFGFHTVGCENYEWKEDTQLRVHMDVKPQVDSKKFRFVTFAGYTSGGSGRNQRQLDEKAMKIESTLLEIANVEAQVNPFSLEIENANDVKNILVEFWVK